MRGRPTGEPHLVERSGEELRASGLERLRLGGVLSEEWLQELLDRCPAILPIASIDERVEPPLFSLGREIPTPAGPIDNLFVSRGGHLVVVETKLWRNPEARRQVVAQILDYAKHVRGWSYESLCAAAGKNIWDLVRPTDVEEADWIDGVSANLAAGRMTLLVVGDGVHEEARGLVDLFSAHPAFPFRLALVELRVHQLAEGRWFVVPSVMAKTVEIERAVVRIEAGTRVSVETPPIAPEGTRRRSALSEQQLREDLREQPDGAKAVEVMDALFRELDRPELGILNVFWASKSVTIKTLAPTGSGRLLSLACATNAGDIYTYLDWLTNQLEEEWGEIEAVQRASKAQADLFTRFGGRLTPGGKQINIRMASLKGKERAFADGLAELARGIERLAAKEREGS